MSLMPNAATQPALLRELQEPSDTLTKPEACALLGKSKRTVETLVAKGRLAVGYVQGPNGKTARFRRADVEALKAELDTPSMRAVVPANGAQNGPEVPRDGSERRSVWGDPDWLANFATLTRALPPALPAPEAPPRVKPWLSLGEASAWSGLPSAWLLAQARAGKIRAVQVGTGTREFWRFSREGLER